MAQQELLFAEDIHRKWTAAVRAAQSSIVVYTPYFDRLLPRLLSSARARGISITVVTDLSPTGGQNYGGQLRASKRLLELGISLKTLPRLHAKVLVVDEQRVVLGSQNFTTFARSSKEASTVPPVSVSAPRFHETLDSWLDLAVEVDGPWIDALLAGLLKAARVLARDELALRDRFDELMDAQKRRRAEEEAERLRQLALAEEALARQKGIADLQRRLLEAARRSPTQFRQEIAVGSVRLVDGETYESFLVNSDNDLTKWVRDGSPVNLRHLEMVPVIRSDTGRMAFARVAKSRITYLRSDVDWGHGRPINILGNSLGVRIKFPAEDCARRNIVATLPIAPRRSVRVNLKFDGSDLHLVSVQSVARTEVPDPDPLALLKTLIWAHFSSPEGREKFFKRYMSRFTYGRLGIENKNARDFFGSSPFGLYVVELAETPVIVAVPPS